MSALIHPENQKIIWNIINNNSYVNKFFAVNTNVSKDKWFRSIIEQFYTQNEGRNLSIEELNNLNKNVLSFMVKSINSIPAQQPPKSYDTLNQNTYSPQIQTPPYIPNNITEQNNRQFEEKKQEYEQMYSKPVPPEVDFKEKEKDTSIENMDELINMHINEREKQLNELKPPLIPNAIKDGSKKESSHETSFENQLHELKDTVERLQKKYDELTDNFTEKIQNQATIIDNLEKTITSMSNKSNKKNTHQELNEQF